MRHKWRYEDIVTRRCLDPSLGRLLAIHVKEDESRVP
jgi:hypothetical protein